MSTVYRFVTIQNRPGYVVLWVHKEPVNSMDGVLWAELLSALDAIEADATVNGLAIASGLKKDVFTAGNDLLELHAPRTTEERYRSFWAVQNTFLARLYRSRLVTVAAIRGACPAGGCAISMCCDYRVMTSEGTIGLNEVALGIPVPKYWGQIMMKLIGPAQAEKLLLGGKLVSAREAYKLGLVDELVDSKEILLQKCESLLEQLVKLPSSARAATKTWLRGEFCRDWEAYAKIEPDTAWPFLNRPEVVAVLGKALERLSSKPKSKM